MLRNYGSALSHIAQVSISLQSPFSYADKIALLEAAISIVLSRDLSLNKRLYKWIDGYENDVLSVLQEQLRNPTESNLTKPYRILLSFMDRENYGDNIFGLIFGDLIDSFYNQFTFYPQNINQVSWNY